MSLTPESIQVKREVKARDGAGGWLITQEVIYPNDTDFPSISASRNFYRRTSTERIEEGTHNSQGPGVATKLKMFYCFERPDPFTAPFPAILVNDRIESPDGTAWKVLFVRPYEETIQVDVEVIE